MSSPYCFTFTVFTATYNRAHTLPRLYESLSRQTFQDFEWLVVDDGSTDATGLLIREFQRKASFPIRYVFQQNAGKHVAVNTGVRLARGELFLSVDSDNAYLPNALERFKFHWDSIPADIKPSFSAVSACSQAEQGRLLGTPFPFDPTDSNSIEIRSRFKVTGEKIGFHRTDVLREFPYPRFPGENRIPDSLVWNRIALKYKTRYVNETLQVYYSTPGSWISNIRKIRAQNPRGFRLSYLELLQSGYPVPPKMQARLYINYVRTSFHIGIALADQGRDIPDKKRWMAAVPLGYLLYTSDRRLNKT